MFSSLCRRNPPSWARQLSRGTSWVFFSCVLRMLCYLSSEPHRTDKGVCVLGHVPMWRMMCISVGVDDGNESGAGGAFAPCGAELESDRRRQAGSLSPPILWSRRLVTCSHEVPWGTYPIQSTPPNTLSTLGRASKNGRQTKTATIHHGTPSSKLAIPHPVPVSACLLTASHPGAPPGPPHPAGGPIRSAPGDPKQSQAGPVSGGTHHPNHRSKP
jgi:hypothetical protein